MSQVKVFGADWCELTQGARGFLEHRGVPYDYVNIEADRDAAEWVREQNGGKERKPTLDIAGEILAEPSNAALEQALRSKHLLD
ncbi:MAG TPA: glutaredoxin family protein [Bryobacteraceae bacterium]|jgi:glutaredoxin|nr:glutaredoxin family protein [Bryobacteraceae bacterium]HXR79120.1 glutaredoxin family protein [Bryobacteraceae bacterium]